MPTVMPLLAAGKLAKEMGGHSHQSDHALDTRAVLAAVLAGEQGGMLCDVRWSHATNSVAELERATNADRPVDFVEADILLDSTSGVPVMAHPPATTSDLSFEAFVDRFVELALEPRGRPIGLKLDFKDPRAVEQCLGILSAALALAGSAWRHPIWLNADIFTGPGGNPTIFKADVFLQQCQSAALPNAALSLGWTTGWSLWICLGMHGYTTAHVDEALRALAKLPRPMAVTWAVRSGIIRQTPVALVRRLTEDRRTLTVWGDVDADIRQWLASPEIAQVAFVDVTPPAMYLKATRATQIGVVLLCLGSALYLLLHGRRAGPMQCEKPA